MYEPQAPQWDYNTPSAQNAAAQAGEFAGRASAAGLAWVGLKAGRNHYDHNEEGIANAAWKGGGAALRWWIWGSWVVLWLFSFALYAFGFYMVPKMAVDTHNQGDALTGMIAMLAVWPLCIGVTWCRFIDFSLFKRGVWYRVFQPLARVLEWCPTWVLFLTILIPYALA